MRLTMVHVSAKFHKNRPSGKKKYGSLIPYKTHVSGLKQFRPLWTREQGKGRRLRAAGDSSDRSTLAGGFSILIICLKHCKMIEIFSLSAINWKFSFFALYRLNPINFSNVGIPCFLAKPWTFLSDSDESLVNDAPNPCLCVCQIS